LNAISEEQWPNLHFWAAKFDGASNVPPMIRASSVLCCGLLASEADAAETTRSISFNSFFPISAVVDADQNIPESSDRASQSIWN
jgi:hypothetical protein